MKTKFNIDYPLDKMRGSDSFARLRFYRVSYHFEFLGKIEVYAHSIALPSLSLIGALTTEIYNRADRKSNRQAETDTLPSYRMGSSKNY